jgi:5-methylcytosine-specific restriction enzyme subunit McrC
MHDRLVLREHEQTPAVPLDVWQVEALRRAVPDLTVVPTIGQPLHFDLKPAATVGTIELDGWPVEIVPKVPVDRLLFLVSYALDAARWQPAQVAYAEATTLVEAVAPLFATHLARALEPGVLHGYRSEDDALHTIRGRIRFGDQLRRRYGDRLPVEVTFDDYTEDIAENRLLKAAIWRLGRFSVPAGVRGALRRYDAMLDQVALLPDIRSAPIHWSRLNEHYRPAASLATLILRASSLDLGGAGHRASGLLINMNEVFEDFLVAALRRSMGLDATQLVQEASGHRLSLDAAGAIGLAPDLSWWDRGRCVLVADAKYKRLSAAGIKHPDLYQLLAYLVATGLPAGALVYPRTEATSVDHDVPGAGVRLLVRTIDLHGQPADILASVDRLADELSTLRSQWRAA